jgi:hypothetical protein
MKPEEKSMEQALLQKRFARMGARVHATDTLSRRTSDALNIRIDIRKDRQGEYFDIRLRPDAPVEVDTLDVQPALRHLVLLVREGREKRHFLCGHDERSWFVAALPEGVSTVHAAMEALKPAEVKEAQAHQPLPRKARIRRRTPVYIRQGEWFFLPCPEKRVDEALALHHEPLSRGRGSKPHIAEACVRFGGMTVYVSPRFPDGLTETEREALFKDRPALRKVPWQTRQRDPEVYVRGKIRHPDHKTIFLPCWHKVVMNREHPSRAVAFLD